MSCTTTVDEVLNMHDGRRQRRPCSLFHAADGIEPPFAAIQAVSQPTILSNERTNIIMYVV